MENREIKNGEQYITLDIYLERYYIENRVVTSSYSRDYMGISGKGMTTSMTLRTKIQNKKKGKNCHY